MNDVTNINMVKKFPLMNKSISRFSISNTVFIYRVCGYKYF